MLALHLCFFISDTPTFSICNLYYCPVDGFIDTEYLEPSTVSATLATVITLPPLYTCQVSLILSNPHCRTASLPSTAYTEVGLDS